jgi:hypothetical protein
LDPVNAHQALAFDDGTSANGKTTTEAWLKNQITGTVYFSKWV